MSKPHSLQFFTRDGCHLCERMEAALAVWVKSRRIVLVHCDVDNRYEWFERYDRRVPVLANDKVVICEGHLNPNILNRYLQCETQKNHGGLQHVNAYERVWALVACISSGYVTTYGHIAALEGRVIARAVGNAMSKLPSHRKDVPWQRVINAKGQISKRVNGKSVPRQRQLLETEGVLFGTDGRVDFDRFGWTGPDWDWLNTNGYYMVPPPANHNRRRK